MSVDGIWTTELMGLFGWEPTGVLLLENGRAIGGGNVHYSVGSYDTSSGDLHLSVDVEFHGPPRTIFGAADRNLTVEFKGKIQDGVIEGSAYRADKPDQSIAYRLTRRADIPPV